MSITVTSTAFEPGARMPVRHTGDGPNTSPPVGWSGLPREAVELALIVDDPDAPGAEPWVHWVVYGIPASLGGLPEGLPSRGRLSEPMGVRQGRNDFQRAGYGGPSPPRGHGRHRYRFHVYALDARLDLEPGLTKAELLRAMAGHVLAEGELVGTYER